jgi:uncharacterized protein GlcG (DUF336 family)
MISLAQAKTMIDTAFSEGKRQNMKPLAAIVMTASADVIAFERQDDSEVLRFEMAYGKAVSALTTGRNSRFMAEKMSSGSHLVTLVDRKTSGRFMPFPGAILIKSPEGAILGVMAVSGDTSENDELVAIAGIMAAGLVASDM